MSRSLLLCIVILLMGNSHLSAEDSMSEGKALNFPTSRYGISIGNSHEFTGIRINFADENVKQVNGLNITFWFKYAKNQEAVYNGINLGTFAGGNSLQFINVGLIGAGAAHKNITGFNVAGIVIGSGGDINGLSAGGLLVATDEGDEVSINGITVAGLAVATDGNINGITSSLACLHSRRTQGVSITVGYLGSEIYKGAAVAGYSNTEQMNGLSVALFNKTKELHGVQLGLLNYAESNPKGLRLLPFINFHL